MAVNRTIRTRLGVSKFVLQSENGNESCTAFLYTDNTIEIHSLKKDCQPLILEENTKVNITKGEGVGELLCAVTIRPEGEVFLRFWDLSSSVGFLAKEICSKQTKDKCYTLQHELPDAIENIILSSYKNLVCIILNGKYLLLISVKEECGDIKLDVETSTLLHQVSTITNAVFLTDLKDTYLCLSEGIDINVMLVDANLSSSCVVSLPKKLPTMYISCFHRVTCSKSLIVDNEGQISLFSLPNEITPLKFPGSKGGHDICSVIGFQHTSEGILAICNGEHTINLYSLADVLSSVAKGCSTYIKPYRILCSQFPLNSITFVRSDQLALASSVNQSITFWGGFSN